MGKTNYTIIEGDDHEGGAVRLTPTPRINLHDLDAVRREMTRVYKGMRTREIPTQEGTRLVYVLGEIRKMFEICELEKRITARGG